MSTYNIKCPICGEINRGLLLEETAGWMECESCKQLTFHYGEKWVKMIPVYSGRMREKETVSAH